MSKAYDHQPFCSIKQTTSVTLDPFQLTPTANQPITFPKHRKSFSWYLPNCPASWFHKETTKTPADKPDLAKKRKKSVCKVYEQK
jgi:hypothetical protein